MDGEKGPLTGAVTNREAVEPVKVNSTCYIVIRQYNLNCRGILREEGEKGVWKSADPLGFNNEICRSVGI